ncbi:MAG: HD domain-containing phosphohydrolase [Acidimicrobiia bacterium]|jgi:HD-GYP domain-containing protein (c-di-GMP phosphodiesterase class II)
MAEHRLHRLSVILFLLITSVAAASTILLYRSEVSWESWALVLLWAAVIAAFHAISVPTPSGKRINLAIGPAVAALILLPDVLTVMTALTIGLVGGWIVLRWRSKTDRDADSDYVAEAISMIIFGLVGSAALSSLAGSPMPLAWQQLISITSGAVVWFAVRALVSAWVGTEREDLASRYLWLLALEDWSVALSIFTGGALFGMTWNEMGLWAFPVAILPYAFSHLAFVRYNSTRITYGQMIRALAQIPEVADLAPRGHSARTADLAVAIAREIGLHPNEVTELEYAALMHDVGRITLTEPAILKAGYTDEDIARWGAQIIAEAPYLREVSEYVRVQHSPYRRPGEAKDPDIPMISKIIKISSSYDQAVHELQLSPLEGLERVHRGSAYDFDPEVAASLRRVLVQRGVIAA